MAFKPIISGMSCCIPESVYSCWDSFQKDVGAEIDRIPGHLGRADMLLAAPVGLVSYGLMSAGLAVGSVAKNSAEKTSAFVSNNWPRVIAYIFVWGLIVTCTGLLYGFEAVALPLTIGLAGGIGFGVLAGILSVNSYDTKGKYTPWNLLNQGIQGVEEKVTQGIVLSVAITVLLAFSVVFPHAVGAICGLFLAMQVVVKIATGQDLGPDPENELNERLDIKQKLEVAMIQLADIDTRLKLYEADGELRKDFAAALSKVTDLKKRFDALAPPPTDSSHDSQ